MEVIRYFILAVGAMALNVSGSALSADASARHCTSEECACEQALEQNTVEALEDFLRKYPQSVNNGDSACGALAIPPGDEMTIPDGHSDDDSGSSPEKATSPSEG
jgi:hypothetical protein